MRSELLLGAAVIVQVRADSDIWLLVTRGWLQDLVGGEKDRTCSWIGCKHVREGS